MPLRKTSDCDRAQYSTWVASQTYQNGMPPRSIEGINISTYEKEAKKYSGHPSNGLKALGVIMLGIAAAVGITVGVLISVGTI